MSATQRTIADTVSAAAAAEGIEPLAFICGRLSAGQNLSVLASELGVSRQNLSTWANALPNARTEMKTAREEGYRAMIERAERLLEDLGPEPSREMLAVCAARIELLKWSAERQARSEWGPASAQQFNVNIGNAFSSDNYLAALRLRVVRPPAALPAAVEEADYVVVEESEPA
jgi:hypothetical protein